MLKKLLALILKGVSLETPKKAPYCVHVWDPQARKWTNQNKAGSSARRCKKARKVLIGLGYDPAYIVIMAKGFDPPPPKGEGKCPDGI
jgi:hypothetical protein